MLIMKLIASLKTFPLAAERSVTRTHARRGGAARTRRRAARVVTMHFSPRRSIYVFGLLS